MMIFLVFATLLALFLALHPFVTFPLSLAVLKRLRGPVAISPPAEGVSPPSLSICFCAHNEEAVIASKVRNLEAVAKVYPGEVEVLAYTDGCTDNSYNAAVEAAEFTKVVRGEKRCGKSGGMNTLVAKAEHELVVFTDANVMLRDDTLAALAAAFAEPEIGCAAGRLVYTNPDEGHVATLGSVYWRLEELIKTLETQTGSTMGADGALFAIRRNLHREVPLDIIDDMYTSLSILCDGKRVVTVPEAIAYERTTTSSSDEWRRKVRIACRSFNCHRLLRPRLRSLGLLDAYKYTSHKLLRWLTVLWLGVSYACAGALAWTGGFGLPFASLTGVLFVLLLLGAFGVPKLRSVTEVLMSFSAVGLGVVHSLQGRRYQTWRPPQSSR